MRRKKWVLKYLHPEVIGSNLDRNNSSYNVSILQPLQFIFRCVRLVVKAPTSLAMFVRLHAGISTALNEWISVKFDTGTSVKICRQTPNLVKIGQMHWALVWRRKYVYCCRRNYIPINALSSSEMVSGYQDSRWSINIMGTRHNVTLYAHCLSRSLTIPSFHATHRPHILSSW